MLINTLDIEICFTNSINYLVIEFCCMKDVRGWSNLIELKYVSRIL